MATSTTVPAQPPAAVVRRRWNTLEILSRARTVLFALTALLLGVIVLATQTHRDAMTLVGKDTAPSIIHAQKIKTALADMDADAADDLLNPGSTRAAGLFDQHRIEASDALIEAAKNVTYEAEKEPIQTIEVVMGTYERLVQEARDLQEAGQPEMAVRYYRGAGIVMDGTLLPAADALDKANSDQLEQEYDSRTTHSLIARLFVLLAGLAMLAALTWVQLFLSRRTRRTLNPALVAATIVALGLTFFAFIALQREQFDLQEARFNAFDSVHALLQARAVAYAANSDESRYLLDPLHADEYQKAFQQKSLSLAALPSAVNRAELPALLRTGKKIPGFTGFLADEYNNITYEGELEAAIDSVVKYEQYLKIDGDLRALQAAGQHDQAVQLDTGDQEGQSDWAFDQFDQALAHALDINQTEFDRAVANGFAAVGNLDWIASTGALVMAVLIFFGFAPRIREYQ